jgi:metal-responsive CopG/Arc/MetJ family transcriptional regulator
MSQTRTISVRITEALAGRLDALSRASGLSQSVLTRLAVEDYVAKVRETGKIEITQVIDVSGAAAPPADAAAPAAGRKTRARAAKTPR